MKTVTGSDSKAAKADGSEDVTKPRVENKDKKGKVGTLSGKKETGAAGGDVPEVVEEKAEEASGQQSAYNEETGEINWDCPVSSLHLILNRLSHKLSDLSTKSLTFSCYHSASHRLSTPSA